MSEKAKARKLEVRSNWSTPITCRLSKFVNQACGF